MDRSPGLYLSLRFADAGLPGKQQDSGLGDTNLWSQSLVVDRLAAEGAKVAFTHRRSNDKSKNEAELKNGRRGLAITADSGDPESLTRAVEETASEFGGIDIFMSNAGTFLFKPIEEFTMDDFNRLSL